MKTRLIIALTLVAALFVLVGCDGATTTEGPDEDVTRVTVSWSEDVDLDLEIWNEDGTEMLTKSWELVRMDEYGTGSEEYFDFKDYGDGGDYSTGSYVVSVYFADYGEDEDAGPHVDWIDPDGDPQTRVTAMDYFGNDQWHVIRIDAATGESEDIDEFVDAVSTE